MKQKFFSPPFTRESFVKKEKKRKEKGFLEEGGEINEIC